MLLQPKLYLAGELTISPRTATAAHHRLPSPISRLGPAKPTHLSGRNIADGVARSSVAGAQGLSRLRPENKTSSEPQSSPSISSYYSPSLTQTENLASYGLPRTRRPPRGITRLSSTGTARGAGAEASWVSHELELTLVAQLANWSFKSQVNR